jgi:hypothetical protein
VILLGMLMNERDLVTPLPAQVSASHLALD